MFGLWLVMSLGIWFTSMIDPEKLKKAIEEVEE